MENSKLVKTIALFNSKERDNFSLFLQSPYFVPAKDQISCDLLFSTICTFLQEPQVHSLDKNEVYKTVFPKQIFIAGKLDKLMSKLMKLLQAFIRIEYANNEYSPTYTPLALANFYYKKEEGKEFAAAIQNSKKQQTKIKAKSIDDYYTDFKIDQQQLIFLSHHNTRNMDINLTNTIDSLDRYYIIQRLRLQCLLYTQNQHALLLDESFNSFIAQYLNNIPQGYTEQHPTIQAYLYAIALFKQPIKDSFTTFNTLKKHLSTHKDNIALEDRNLLNSTLRVKAGLLLNNNDSHLYVASVFDLYKTQLEEGSLYFENKIHPSTLKNLVTLALEVQQTEWTYHFLQNHRSKIMGKENALEVFNFNLAYYYFHLQEYNQALDLLAGTYDDIYYKIAAKRLEIKILFEQNSSLLDYKIEAFKVFIFRQNKKHLPQQHLKLNNHFIDILRKIIHPKTLGNTTRIEKIIHEINTTKIIAERKWLTEKLSAEY